MKRAVLAIMLIASLTGVAACSSSGTHTQSLSPSSPSSSSTSSTASPSRSTTSSTSVATKPKPIPTPTVTPPAQGAVDAYVSMANVLDGWDHDPKKANAAQLQPYVTDKTISQLVAIYKGMAAHGLAYRGDPDTPHLTVLVAGSSLTALSDCPTPSATNPAVEYVVATGKPVPPPANPIPGLHPKAVTVLFTAGRWKVQSIIPNEAKVCTP